MSEKITCFLIDDDCDDQEIFKTAFEELDEGFSCVVARDAKHAFEVFENDHTFLPDFIFLDIHMPLMDGRQFLVEIKKIDRLRQIPAFIYTTTNDPTVQAEAEELGAAGFIIKPTTFSDIKEKLRQIIGAFPLNDSSLGTWYKATK